MNNIKNTAMKMVVTERGNIAELEKVSTELLLLPRTGTNQDGEEFEYLVAVIDKKEYRVPQSVLQQLKGILEHKPQLEWFKVLKTGEGMKTKYQVIAL